MGARAGSPKSVARPVEELISHRIITLANLLRRSATLRYRRMFGLALIEWRVIAVLGTGRPVSLNELARRVGLSKSQMSRGVSGLVRKRIVSRAQNASDSREIALALSADGQAIYAAFKQAADKRNRALVAGMGAGEVRRLSLLLALLTERAQSLLRAGAKRAR